MTIYLTSDNHFFHNNVIRYCNRPYKDVEEMNEALVRNWNNVVGPEDTVYCLGDFSLAIRPVESFSNRLMGIKKLIPGNHDWCHPANKKSRGKDEYGNNKLDKWIKFYENNGWEVLPIFSEFDIPGVAKVNLCHMPYKGDNTDERYQDFRLKNDGRFLLCGHVHEKWKVKDKMINVGVDVWNYKPVSIDEISKIILGVDNEIK